MTDHLAAGLDFGTSNSAIGVHDGRRARLHRFAGGSTIAPSAVFFDALEQSWAFGHEAEACFLAGSEGRYLRALKSVLSTPLAGERTRLGARAVPFTEILERFLGALKAEAEAAAGAPLTRVVAGRPVHFVDRHPERDAEAQATLEAVLRRVGFEEIAFVHEPVGAAIDARGLIDAPGLALVADIGGGTSDVAVLEVDPARPGTGRVLASAGIHVGGTDFDRELSLAHVMPELGHGTATRPPMSSGPVPVPNHTFLDLATWQRIPLLYTPRTLREVEAMARHALEPARLGRLPRVLEEERGHALLAAVERAKIALSTAPRTAIEAGDDLPSLPLTRAALDAALGELAGRIAEAVDEALRLAGVVGEAVAFAVLTGGSTLLPTVHEAIAARLPRARAIRPDRFAGIAHGLTLEAGRRFLGTDR